MLVLSRRVNQAIVFGPQDGAFVRVTVLQTKKSTVRLAIEAPGQIQLFRAEIEDALENRALVASQGDAHSGAAAGQKHHPSGGTAQQNETASHGSMLVYSQKVGEEISFGGARLTVLKITRGPHVRLGITAPQEWLVYPEEAFGAMSRSATAHESNRSQPSKNPVRRRN